MNNIANFEQNIKPNYKETYKFKQWVQAFWDKGSDTYGNKTRSALKAYSLNEKTQYFSASKIGQENYQKLSNLASMYADKEGFGFGDLMKIGIKKMIDGNFDDWVRFMILLGYFEKNERPQILQQFNFAESFKRMRKERGLPE